MKTLDQYTILNEFNHTLKPSQKKWAERFINIRNDCEILQICLTKGGYISIDYKTPYSKMYPYRREIRGVRAGWIATYRGKEYDHEHNWILDGIQTDKLSGTKKLIVE